MLVNEVIMDCTFIPMLSHSVSECLGGKTDVVTVAIPTGIVGAYKVVDYISFGFMFTFRGSVITHEKCRRIVRSTKNT